MVTSLFHNGPSLGLKGRAVSGAKRAVASLRKGMRVACEVSESTAFTTRGAFSPEHAESRAVRGPAGANAVSRAGPEPGPPATAGCQGRVHGDVTATDGKNRLRTAWAGTTSVPVWPKGSPNLA